jgi:hypothetical protein
MDRSTIALAIAYILAVITLLMDLFFWRPL